MPMKQLSLLLLGICLFSVSQQRGAVAESIDTMTNFKKGQEYERKQDNQKAVLWYRKSANNR
jgi:hypothetical protein